MMGKSKSWEREKSRLNRLIDEKDLTIKKMQEVIDEKNEVKRSMQEN